MTTLTAVLLDRAALREGDTLSIDETVDLGAYATLGVVLTVHEAGAGEAPTLVVEHAITNEEDAFVPFDPAIEIALDATGTESAMKGQILRWLRWRIAGTLTGQATVSLAILARG